MENILFPIGRLVGGSLYKTFEQDNKKQKWFIAYAIKKNGESHWNQTEWGRKLFEIGAKGFPNGQTNNPSFAWKIEDGDSEIPKLTKDGKTLIKPCDKEGYGGHWVVNFSNGFSPILCDEHGKILIMPEDSIKWGDFIQVYASVKENGSAQSPGLYVTHTHVAFMAYGERISTKIDPTTIAFGGALPVGASKTPVNSNFNPSPVAALHSILTAPPAPVPTPYPSILKPKIMTALAAGNSYESFIAQNWTDELLIQHGYMQA